MSKSNKCLMCETELNHEGECPMGCTEKSDYGVMEGACWDERDIKIKSLAAGHCLDCGGELNCAQGCYNAASYTDDIESSLALEKGVCLECGGEVDCPNKCLGGEDSGIGEHQEWHRRADDPFLETGKWAPSKKKKKR